jgi:hypothetical protein
MFGNYNNDVYSGSFCHLLANDPLRLKELCFHTTGKHLPPTHQRGRYPIDAIFGSGWVEPTTVTLLPSTARVGDHWVFIIDFASHSIFGDNFSMYFPPVNNSSTATHPKFVTTICSSLTS